MKIRFSAVATLAAAIALLAQSAGGQQQAVAMEVGPISSLPIGSSNLVAACAVANVDYYGWQIYLDTSTNTSVRLGNGFYTNGCHFNSKSDLDAFYTFQVQQAYAAIQRYCSTNSVNTNLPFAINEYAGKAAWTGDLFAPVLRNIYVTNVNGVYQTPALPTNTSMALSVWTVCIFPGITGAVMETLQSNGAWAIDMDSRSWPNPWWWNTNLQGVAIGGGADVANGLLVLPTSRIVGNSRTRIVVVSGTPNTFQVFDGATGNQVAENPLNLSANFKSIPGSVAVIGAGGDPGRRYAIQTSPSLTGTNWTTVSTNVVANYYGVTYGSTMLNSFANGGATNVVSKDANCFFRAEALDAPLSK